MIHVEGADSGGGGGAPPTATSKANEAPTEEAPYAIIGYKDIFRQFVMLGWTAFGGPQAHIAVFIKVS